MPSDLNLGIVYAAVRLRNEFTPEMQKVVAAAQKAGQEMQAAGRVITLGITAPLVGAALAAIKTSIDFESSFTGVRKTVNATEPELQALSDGFRALALEIPANVNELNKIGEAAGQLGIQTPNILGFTETMAALGVTTNLSSEAAATSLARLANITGLQQDQFDNLGSAIVGLGNNFATTESEIVDFGLRIAGAGELAGLSEGEILGIGTAMSSIGVQAEAGGTAVQKVLNEINQSVATGDEELRVFAEVAGMTAEEFSAAFRDDAAGAFESFVTGLGTQGDKSFTVMEDLGLESERVIRAFLGLANAGDLLSDAMEEGNKSFEDNVALMIEAEQRYGTTESRLALLWARVRELGITLGDSLIPAVHSFIDLAAPMLTFVTDAVKWWSKWPAPLKLASLAVLALVAAVGPALLIGGTILTSWATLTLAFPVLGAALAAAGLKATAFWVALSGPIGWVIAAIAAVTGAIFYFREELGLVKPSIEDMGLEAARQHVADLEERFDGLSGRGLPSARIALEKARDALKELEAAAADADGAVEKLTKDNFPAFAVTLQDAEAQLAQAKDGLNRMAAAGMVVDSEMENWVDGLEEHVTALRDTKASTDSVAEGIDALVSKWTGARFDVDKFSAAFGELTDEQRANKTIMGEVMSAYGAARAKIGPFNDALERLWQAEKDAAAEAQFLTDQADFLASSLRGVGDDAEWLAKKYAKLDEDAAQVVDAFDRQRDALLGLPTPEVTADFDLLLAVWESFEGTAPEDVTARFAAALTEAADNGVELSDELLAIIAAGNDTDDTLGDLDVSLAALAGGLGGAAGQGINLALSMMQANDELAEGEEGFSNTQIGAAALGGALGALGDEVGGTAGKILSAAGNIASAFATGGPIAAAIAATIEWFKFLGGVIDNMINGAQMRFNDLTDAIVGSLDAIRDGSLTAAEAFDKATNWEGNEEGYERLRATQQLWVDAGLSAAEATVWAERFAEANRNQDPAALQALLVEYENVAAAAGMAATAAELLGGPSAETIEEFEHLNEVWAMLDETGQVTAAATANYAQRLLEARDAGIELTAAQDALADNAALIAAFDAAAGAAISAFGASEAAGVRAYDETLKKALESGLGQEAAVAQATAAQLAASVEVLAAKGVEYARIAAFDAAMALGANATAAERIAAARAAATAASESWDAAMVAVVASDQAANDALDGTWNPETGGVVTNVQGSSEAIQEEMAAAERDIKSEFEKMAVAAKAKSDDIAQEFQDATDRMVLDAKTLAWDVNEALGTIEDHGVDVTYHERENPPLTAQELADRTNKALAGILDKHVEVTYDADNFEELADDITGLLKELDSLNRKIIDSQIDSYEAKRDTVLAGIDAEIEATEALQTAALGAIDEQIAKVNELTEARLNAVKIQLAVAQGAVIDVSATKGIAERLNIDISDATVFGAQEASNRITELAEDIALLQKAGVEVTAGISAKFDAEMRAAVAAVNRFGVTVPQSLRQIVSTFPGIELDALAFGDGLTEAARRVKELEDERDAIQAEANERLEALALERQEIEEAFAVNLAEWEAERMLVEAKFTQGLQYLNAEREAIENSTIETLGSLRNRRAQVEEDLIVAVGLAANRLDAGSLRPGHGFAGGTRGRFVDFGSSSTIQVHGKERIVTEDEGRREAAGNAASLRGVEDRLDRLDSNLQRAIKRISTDVTNVVMTKSL